VPVQTPAWQASDSVQMLPSAHGVPFGCLRFAGQKTLVPVQVSATSQGPAAGRQTVPAVTKASGGHSAEAPVQVSATSQGPADGRHTVPAGKKGFGGQVALAPVQKAFCSQGPAATRQTVVGGANASGGQSGDWPVQVSATSQGPAAGRQTFVLGESGFDGQAALLPSQTAFSSQALVAVRQTVPAALGVRTHWPVLGLQAAVSQGPAASQEIGVPRQVPSLWQTSFVVQALPSSQTAPVVGLHVPSLPLRLQATH
jgi:hypothetical protein